MKSQNKIDSTKQYNLVLLNPVIIFTSLTLLYFIPAYVSGMYFSEVPGLTLSPEASNPILLKKGLLLVIESISFFALGFYILNVSPKIPKSFVFLTSKSIISICLAAVLIGIVIYGPVRYFAGGYAVYDTDDTRWQLGNGIVYFCAEVLIGLSLVVEIFNKRKITPVVTFLAMIILFLLLFRLKRLELLIAILSFFSFYVCVKKISKTSISIFLACSVIAISLVGGLRFGLENASWMSVTGSILFEANYTLNSLFGTIYLIDERHFDYTYGLNLASIPIRVIPSFLFPYKYEVVGYLSDDNWSRDYVLSPLGASFGLSHLYRYGGQISVIIFSTCLGCMFKFMYTKFKVSLLNNVKSIYLLFYPIILYSFTFHFIRDDVTVAFKFLFQLLVLYYVFVLTKSELLKSNRLKGYPKL
jgi:hypothetical protein